MILWSIGVIMAVPPWGLLHKRLILVQIVGLMLILIYTTKPHAKEPIKNNPNNTDLTWWFNLMNILKNL